MRDQNKEQEILTTDKTGETDKTEEKFTNYTGLSLKPHATCLLPFCIDRIPRKDKEFTPEMRRNAEKTLKEIKSSKTQKVLKTLDCEGRKDLLLISSLRFIALQWLRSRIFSKIFC